MCPPDKNPKEEILLLPNLIREHGWSCFPLREGNTFLQGGSGPLNKVDFPATEKHEAATISVIEGVAFNVTAREEDLKVRIGWPGQFTTSFSCSSAEQVVWWLGKMIAIAEEDYKRMRKSREP